MADSTRFEEVAATVLERLCAASGSTAVLRKFVDDTPTDGADSSSIGGGAVAGHEQIGRDLHPDSVDGSALLVLGGFGPFRDDRLPTNTLSAVEACLTADGGGVHRYLEDSYCGGGLWVLLAGALAWAQRGRDDARADEVLAWIERQADDRGHLPEQTAAVLRAPDSRQPWIDRWGPPAHPLLWSHAMYLLAAAD